MVTIEDQGLSYVQYKADGVAVNFMLTFPYLRQQDISVFLDGVLVSEDDWSWLNEGEIQMDVAPALDALLTIKRTTEQTERLVDFQDGGQVSEETLDLDSNQLFYLSQEAIDTTNFNLAINSTDATIDAKGNKIINVQTGTDNGDAVNKGQMDAADAATLNSAIAADAAIAATAASAVATANAAQATANTALSTANAAEATANGIAATANEALSTANDAAADASDALSQVTDAQTDATQALADAAAAQTDADNAQTDIDNAQDAITAGLGTGITSFGGLTINADPSKFDVGALTAWFVDNTTDPMNPTRMEASFPANNGNSVTAMLTALATYVGVNSAGVIIQQTTPFTAAQRRTIIAIGQVIHSNHTIVNAVNNNPTVSYAPTNQLEDLMEGMGPFNMSGNVVSANGANLNINKTAGMIFKRGSNYVIDPLNPHQRTISSGTALTFRYRLQDSDEGADTTLIDPTQYDVAGVSTLVPAATNFTIQRVALFQTGLVRIQYGQAAYTNLANALAAIGTENFVYEQNIRENGLIIGYIVVRRNATDLSNAAQCQFVQAPKFAGGSAGGVGTVPTLQGAYNNSTTPEITTDATLGALSLKRGSAADTDAVLEIHNGAGTVKAQITGEGNFTGGIVDPTRSDVKKDTKANLDTYALTATNGQMCFATDLKQMYQVVDGLLSSVGGSTGTLATILQMTGDEGVANWTTGDNATFLGAGAISGTFVKNTTAPFQGLSDFKYTQAAGSLNDYMASPSFAVDPRFRGKNATLVMMSSYDGATNDIEVIFYDATNSVIIPSSSFVQQSTDISIFKTNIVIPPTCANIRIGFQTKVLNSGKIFRFDSVELTADTTIFAQLANMQDTTSFTASGQWTTNVTYSGFYTRFGEWAKIQWKWDCTNSPTGSTQTLNMPSGLVIDSSKLKITAPNNYVGLVSNGMAWDNSGAVGHPLYAEYQGNTGQIAAMIRSTAGTYEARAGLSVTVPFTAATSDSYELTAWVPIVGWVSNNTNILTSPDIFSSDTASFVYAGSSSYSITTLANAPVGTFITFTYTASTVNVKNQTNAAAPTQTSASMNASGILITGRVYSATGTTAAPPLIAIQIGKGHRGLSLRGYAGTNKGGANVSLSPFRESTNAQYGLIVDGYSAYNPDTGILILDAGTLQSTSISTRGFWNDTGNVNADCYITITASKNPALTGLNVEQTGCCYFNTNALSVSTSGTDVTYQVKHYDSHNAMNTSTGEYTIPSSGVYTLSGGLLYGNDTYSTNGASYLVFKTGTTILAQVVGRAQMTSTLSIPVYGSITDYFPKGTIVKMTAYSDSGPTALQTSADLNWFSVTKHTVG